MCFVTDLCHTVICIIANEENKTERLIFWQITPNSNYSVFLTSVCSKQKMKLDSLLYSKCSRFSQCFHSTKEILKSFPFWFQSWPLNRHLTTLWRRCQKLFDCTTCILPDSGFVTRWVEAQGFICTDWGINSVEILKVVTNITVYLTSATSSTIKEWKNKFFPLETHRVLSSTPHGNSTTALLPYMVIFFCSPHWGHHRHPFNVCQIDQKPQWQEGSLLQSAMWLGINIMVWMFCFGWKCTITVSAWSRCACHPIGRIHFPRRSLTQSMFQCWCEAVARCAPCTMYNATTRPKTTKRSHKLCSSTPEWMTSTQRQSQTTNVPNSRNLCLMVRNVFHFQYVSLVFPLWANPDDASIHRAPVGNALCQATQLIKENCRTVGSYSFPSFFFFSHIWASSWMYLTSLWPADLCFVLNGQSTAAFDEWGRK